MLLKAVALSGVTVGSVYFAGGIISDEDFNEITQVFSPNSAND